MKLSIITINYNDAKGLLKTIESVITQTFKDYEYIIIDGGSTDGSVDVIKEYEDKITYWVSEPDKGVYNAMNKGIIKATGEYLLFLNSADWLLNNAVLKNIFFELSECDMVYGNLLRVEPNGAFFNDKGPNGKPITLFTFFQATINHQSAFLKRDLFTKYGLYDENLKIVSDWKFFMIVFGLNDAIAIYRDIDTTHFDPTGISMTQLELRNLERDKVIEELIPSSISYDYKKYILIDDKLSLINKYFITSKIFRVIEVILIRIAKFLNKFR